MTSIEERRTFAYSGLQGGELQFVHDAAARIAVRLTRTADEIVEIGRDLIEVKRLLGHGCFGAWIEVEFGMSDQTARNFMNVASRLGKSKTVLEMAPTVLYALAAPSTPDEVVDKAVTLAKAGNIITAADVTTMKDEWVKERRKLKKRIEKQSEQLHSANVARRDAERLAQEEREAFMKERARRENAEWRLEQENRASAMARLLEAWEAADEATRREFLERVTSEKIVPFKR